MKYAKDFRQMAREALNGKWKLAAVVCLIAVLLGEAGSEGLNIELEIEDTWAKAVVQFAGIPVSSFGGGQSSLIGGFLIEHAKIIAIATLFLGVFYLLLGSIIELGHARFHLNLIDRREAEVKDLFEYFFIWKKAILATFLQILYIIFWMFLFIIPGIIALFDYSMTSCILAEHPELSANEAIKRSKEIMKGNRWRLFCLELSFIGWAILCAFTLGIGQLWLIPYKKTTIAAFYREISGTWDEPESLDYKDEAKQKAGIVGMLIIFLVLFIIGAVLVINTKRLDNQEMNLKESKVEQLLKDYHDEAMYFLWKYDIDLENDELTPELVERMNMFITTDSEADAFDFSGFMTEIALIMNADEDISVYQAYGPLKGYYIRHIPNGSALGIDDKIVIEKGQSIADVSLNQKLERTYHFSGKGPSDGTVLVDGQRATHNTYFKILYGTILHSERNGYFIDENTAYLADYSVLSSIGTPSYVEVGNEILNFESPYELQLAIESRPTDFIADEAVDIFSKAFWNDVTSIEYYEGSEIPYVVTNDVILQEIGLLISDLEYQETEPPMMEGGWFFNIYKGDEMFSTWISNNIISFYGKHYQAPTEMLGDEIRLLIMDNYDMSIRVEEKVVGDYRIHIRDLWQGSDTPINLEIRFLTDKGDNILQNTKDIESKYEYAGLEVKMVDESERTKYVTIKLEGYALSFRFDIETCEVFGIEKDIVE